MGGYMQPMPNEDLTNLPQGQGLDPHQIILQHLLGLAQMPQGEEPQAAMMPNVNHLDQRSSGPKPNPVDYGASAPKANMIPSHPNLGNFLEGLLNGFTAKVNPGYFQQNQENSRHLAQMNQQRDEFNQTKSMQDRQFKNLQEQQTAQAAAAEEATKNHQQQVGIENLFTGRTVDPKSTSQIDQRPSFAGQEATPASMEQGTGPLAQPTPPVPGQSAIPGLDLQSIFGRQASQITGPQNPNQINQGGIQQAIPQAGSVRPGELRIPSNSLPPELQQLAGPDGLTIDKKEIPAIASLLEKGRQSKNMMADAKSEADKTKGLIDQFEPNPARAGLLKNEIDAAMVKIGSNNGSTSELFQATKDARAKLTSAMDQKDKFAAELQYRVQEENALAPGRARQAFENAASAERGRQSVAPQADPDVVHNAADMILENPDNYGVVKDTLMKDKNFSKALGQEFVKRGLDFQKFPAQVQESRAYAQVADKELGPLMQKIETLNKDGKLGPLASRYNAFMQGQVGSGDPDYSQLSGEVDLMRKLVGKIHLGVRGAGSPQNAEAMKTKLDEGKMDSSTLLAGLRGYKTYIDLYKRMGLRTKDEAQGQTPSNSGGGKEWNWDPTQNKLVQAGK